MASMTYTVRSLPRRLVEDFGGYARDVFFALLCLCYGCWASPRAPERCDFCGTPMPKPTSKR